jgi:DNA polymerase-1
MLDKALKTTKPTHVLIAFDISGDNFRKKIDKNYKSNRESISKKDYDQNEDIKNILTKIGIKHISIRGCEADDIIGTYVQKSKAQKNIILSGDKDLFQLIDEKTIVMYPEKGISKFKNYDIQLFEKEFEISVDKYIELKALVGDESDNIKGVSGCGIKTASKILNKYGSIEGILENKNNLTNKLKDNILTWYPYFNNAIKIFTILKDIDVPYSYDDCFLDLNWGNASEIFYDLEFYSFIEKVKGGKFYNVNK